MYSYFTAMCSRLTLSVHKYVGGKFVSRTCTFVCCCLEYVKGAKGGEITVYTRSKLALCHSNGGHVWRHDPFLVFGKGIEYSEIHCKHFVTKGKTASVP